VKKKEALQNFQEKVEDCIYFAKQIGTAYGGSTLLGMLGVLASAPDLEPNNRISVFAYGSGCQSEFYSVLVGPNATQQARALEIGSYLNERKLLTIAQYEKSEYARRDLIDCANHEPPRDILDGMYENCYAGQGLLVLKQVENYSRSYEWS
jgi:hydroxymethylglutaryl-CoA synthase